MYTIDEIGERSAQTCGSLLTIGKAIFFVYPVDGASGLEGQKKVVLVGSTCFLNLLTNKALAASSAEDSRTTDRGYLNTRQPTATDSGCTLVKSGKGYFALFSNGVIKVCDETSGFNKCDFRFKCEVSGCIHHLPFSLQNESASSRKYLG